MAQIRAISKKLKKIFTFKDDGSIIQEEMEDKDGKLDDTEDEDTDVRKDPDKCKHK